MNPVSFSLLAVFIKLDLLEQKNNIYATSAKLHTAVFFIIEVHNVYCKTNHLSVYIERHVTDAFNFGLVQYLIWHCPSR